MRILLFSVRQRKSLIIFINFNRHKKNKKLFINFSSASFQTLALFMASESENFTTVAVAAAAEDDVKYGFQRPEMYKTNLSGTVDPPYERHVFLCYKSHEVWPSHIENSDADPLPQLLAATFKARKNDFKVKTRLTICEGREDIELLDGDVLIFPDMIKYRGLKESDVEGFVKDVVVSGRTWTTGEQVVLTGSYVFVCAHNNRDRRCGVCGPVLMEKFEEEIKAKELKNQVFVTACSHIGGHKYAGNLIIFSADSEGKIAGHWYGYVTPNDVSELLDQHIGKGEIIQRIWRGQMGAPVKVPGTLDEEKLPNGSTVNKVEEKTQDIGAVGAPVKDPGTLDEEKLQNGSTVNKVEKKTQDVGADERKESCCQGSNGFQCCRDASFEEKTEKTEKGGFGWISKWEQGEVLTAVAVLGAVATVAVAYGFRRWSR